MTNREIDALVAEKVMGVKREDLYDTHTGKLLTSEHWGPPFYSTDIEAAWQVFCRFTSRYLWHDDATDAWHCHLDSTRRMMADCRYHATSEDETGAEAICLAALAAVGVEVTA